MQNIACIICGQNADKILKSTKNENTLIAYKEQIKVFLKVPGADFESDLGIFLRKWVL